jgi:hypothetical protein
MSACPFTEVVLARLLDGDLLDTDLRAVGDSPAAGMRLVDGRLVSGEEIDRHAAECPECAARLRAARRLDAWIAAGAESTGSGAVGDDALLASAMAAIAREQDGASDAEHADVWSSSPTPRHDDGGRSRSGWERGVVASRLRLVARWALVAAAVLLAVAGVRSVLDQSVPDGRRRVSSDDPVVSGIHGERDDGPRVVPEQGSGGPAREEVRRSTRDGDLARAEGAIENESTETGSAPEDTAAEARARESVDWTGAWVVFDVPDEVESGVESGAGHHGVRSRFRGASASGISLRRLTAAVTRPDLAAASFPLVRLRAMSLGLATGSMEGVGLAGSPSAYERVAERMRVAFLAALVERARAERTVRQGSSASEDALVQAIAHWPDPRSLPELGRVVVGLLAVEPTERANGREASRGAARIERALELRLMRGADRDPDAVLAVARLGLSRRLDARLVESIRGDDRALDEVVSELRGATARPGAARLLLDLWRDLDVRGRLDGEAVEIARWFERDGLAAASCASFADDLADVLRGSRNAEERERALLASAFLREPRLLTLLDGFVVGAARQEALLAAFAIARTLRSDPGTEVDLGGLSSPAWPRGIELAVRAAAGDASARRALTMRCSSEEEAFVVDESSRSPTAFRYAAAIARRSERSSPVVF